MVALAYQHQIPFDALPHDAAPTRRTEKPWTGTLPVMRTFPRLAVEGADEPTVDARFEEEPERWDGLA